MKEIEELKKELEELKSKISALELSLTHIKAVEIVRARQIEDSTLNRSLIKDIAGILTEKKFVGGISSSTKSMLEKVLIDDQIIDIVDCLRGNQKLAAIKTVRQITGAGLKDAKDIVEAIQSKFLTE
jgi:ribosomal protein L7/L12